MSGGKTNKKMDETHIDATNTGGSPSATSISSNKPEHFDDWKLIHPGYLESDYFQLDENNQKYIVKPRCLAPPPQPDKQPVQVITGVPRRDNVNIYDEDASYNYANVSTALLSIAIPYDKLLKYGYKNVIVFLFKSHEEFKTAHGNIEASTGPYPSFEKRCQKILQHDSTSAATAASYSSSSSSSLAVAANTSPRIPLHYISAFEPIFEPIEIDVLEAGDHNLDYNLKTEKRNVDNQSIVCDKNGKPALSVRAIKRGTFIEIQYRIFTLSSENDKKKLGICVSIGDNRFYSFPIGVKTKTTSKEKQSILSTVPNDDDDELKEVKKSLNQGTKLDIINSLIELAKSHDCFDELAQKVNQLQNPNPDPTGSNHVVVAYRALNNVASSLNPPSAGRRTPSPMIYGSIIDPSPTRKRDRDDLTPEPATQYDDHEAQSALNESFVSAVAVKPNVEPYENLSLSDNELDQLLQTGHTVQLNIVLDDDSVRTGYQYRDENGQLRVSYDPLQVAKKAKSRHHSKPKQRSLIFRVFVHFKDAKVFLEQFWNAGKRAYNPISVAFINAKGEIVYKDLPVKRIDLVYRINEDNQDNFESKYADLIKDTITSEYLGREITTYVMKPNPSSIPSASTPAITEAVEAKFAQLEISASTTGKGYSKTPKLFDAEKETWLDEDTKKQLQAELDKVHKDIDDAKTTAFNLPRQNIHPSSFPLVYKHLKMLGEKVTEVDLSMNGLKSAQVNELLAYLLTNKTITMLNLHFNPTDNDCIEGLINVLKTNTILKEIYLDSTSITDHGIELLANGLPEELNITRLNLLPNKNITRDSADKLERIRQKVKIADDEDKRMKEVRSRAPSKKDAISVNLSGDKR